jgi:hypothetical protein
VLTTIPKNAANASSPLRLFGGMGLEEDGSGSSAGKIWPGGLRADKLFLPGWSGGGRGKGAKTAFAARFWEFWAN